MQGLAIVLTAYTKVVSCMVSVKEFKEPDAFDCGPTHPHSTLPHTFLIGFMHSRKSLQGHWPCGEIIGHRL